MIILAAAGLAHTAWPADSWRVIDGDTVVVNGETVRLARIDAPEIRGHCASEKRLARAAKARMVELMAGGKIRVERGYKGRMKDRHRRTLGRVYVGDTDVGEVLIQEGLARPWRGRRAPWCSGATQ